MHKFRRFGRLLAATTTTSLVLTGAAVAGAQEEQADATVSFSVTNITDFHGYLESGPQFDENGEAVVDEDGNPVGVDGANTEMGAARLAALMDYVGQDNDVQLRTTSGDNVGGTAFVSAITNDLYTLEALNEMGIDVSAVGNHEFDNGYEDLVGRIRENSNYPILGANVFQEDGAPALKPSEVITDDESGVRVGFVGTVTEQTLNKVSPAGIAGLTFTDPVAAANEEAARLKNEDLADVVILLQHEDIQAFNGFNEHVDAAFGGDSHQRFTNDVDLAQSHEYGKALSELEFTYNTATGEIVEQSITQYDWTSEGVAELTPDPVVADTVQAAVDQADVVGAQVITEIENDYLRGSNPGGETGSNRGTESTATNMLAEANRRAMEEQVGGVELGVMNAGGVRADLTEGPVTYKDAATVQPFGNNLGYADISGQAILDALENQWKGPEEGRPRLSLGVSDNVSYVYDPTAEQGERIIDVMIDGEPLDPAGEYRVAAASFLFEGGDGYFEPTEFTDVGYLDVTAFTDYLGNEDGPSYRTGQAEVGVSGLDELTAGETAVLELSSLSYSSEGEPRAQSVTVELAGQSVTAEVDNTATEIDAGYGEQGRAAVQIEVPADAAGEQTLTITTDAGTEISVPVTVGEGNGGQDASDLPVTGSSAVDSLIGVFASIGSVFAGLFDSLLRLLPQQSSDALGRLIG